MKYETSKRNSEKLIKFVFKKLEHEVHGATKVFYPESRPIFQERRGYMMLCLSLEQRDFHFTVKRSSHGLL